MVAQAESTKSYVLAQTLESTKTVPLVSAKVPLDTNKDSGANAGVDPDMSVSSIQEPVVDASGEVADDDGEGVEEGEDSDEPDRGIGLSPDSVVVGSFVYHGITYAVEPGGELVAIVAVDPAKLPSDFIEAQTIVLPSVVSSDGTDRYNVTRIAEGAFSSFSARGDSEDACITDLTIAASITNIEDGAFSGFETLQRFDIAADNTNYSMYDGCLYDKLQTSLLLIPEGRLGAVRISPNAMKFPEDASSHCAHLTALIVDADSAALTSEDGFLYNVELDRFEFPVPIVVMDGDTVVATTRVSDDASHTDDGPSASLPMDQEITAPRSNAPDEEVASPSVGPMEGAMAPHEVPSGEEMRNAQDDRFVLDDDQSSDPSMTDGSLSETGEEATSFAPSTVISHTFDLRSTAASRSGADGHGTSDPVTVEEDVIVGEGSAAINYSEHQMLDTVGGIGEAYWYLKRAVTTTPPSSAGGSQTVDEVVTLYIDCTEGAEIAEANFVSKKDGDTLNGWHYNYEQTGAWKPVRPLVNRIVMASTVRPEGAASGTASMQNWFFDMTALRDISEVFVPAGVENMAMLFMNCKSLKNVPASFTIGEGAKDVGNVFQHTAVEMLEAGFKLPSTVKRTQCMFMGTPLRVIQPGFTLPDGIENCAKMFNGCRKLEALPAGFTIPSSVVRADVMFRSCEELQTLPAGFTIPEGVRYAQGMFDGCTSLKRLPEGFSLPKSSASTNETTDPDYEPDIEGTAPYDRMFRGCDALNALPDSFDFDLSKANASASFFSYTGAKSDATDANGNLITRYTGSNQAVRDYAGWTGATPSQKRILQGAPAGAIKAMLMIPTGNTIEGLGWEPWAVVYTDPDRKIPVQSDPGAPSMERFEFSGSWYASSSLEPASKFVFGTTVLTAASDGVARLYAGYSIIGDKLATVTNGVPDACPRASWQLEFADKYSTNETGELIVERTTTLHISCEPTAEIARSNFIGTRTVDGTKETTYEWEYGYEHSGAWAAVRSRVQRVVMDADVKPEGTAHGTGSMYSWFAHMPLLEDIENVFVPAGVKNIRMLFFTCRNLKTVPSSFTLGEGVELAGNLFQNTNISEIGEGFTLPSTVKEVNCFFLGTPIKTIPAGFVLPEGVENTLRMFWGSNLTSLPAGFKLPSTLRIAYGMFTQCKDLTSLPAGFTIPEGTEYIQQFFQDCTALKTLPEGFSLPKTSLKASRGDDKLPDISSEDLGPLAYVFKGCDALTTLPDSFDFDLLQANTSKDFFTYSGGTKTDGSTDVNGNLYTYYMGDSAAVKTYPGWTGSNPSQKRILRGVPAGCLKVQFMVPDDSAADGWSVWASRVTGTDKKLPMTADPGRPTLGFFEFESWHTNADLSAGSAFSFGSTVLAATSGMANTARLYARCERIGGNLGTVTNGVPDGVPRASWHIATDTHTAFDGSEEQITTLFIDSEPGAEIARSNFVSTWEEDGEMKTEHGWRYDRTRSGAWESVRSKVDRVVMAKDIRPEGSAEGTGAMTCWFYAMPRLTDISDVFVPEGVRDITMLFFDCSALSYLPASFTLGEGVELAGNLFQGTLISAIGEGFLLPSTVTDVHCMFLRTPIKALPSSFTLPEGVIETFRMFSGCRSLRSLPAGFKLPDSVKIAYGMFNECASLEALPAGFTVPEGAEYIQQMFNGCTALQSLPEGFSLPKSSLKANRGEDKVLDLSKNDLGALDTVFNGCDALRDLPDTFDFDLAQANDSQDFFTYTGSEKPDGTTDANGNLITLYLGTNASVLNYTGWTGANPSQKRILRSKTDLAKEGLSVVRFALPNAGHGTYSASIAPTYYVTASSLAAGTVEYPGSPKAFGYAFDDLRGWRVGLDESGARPSTTSYNFSQTLASQLTPDKVEQVDVGGGTKKPLSYYTIYAHLTGPIYNVSVPMTAKVELDTLFGNTPVPAALRFESLTPEPVTVTRVRGGLSHDASRLFASDGDFGKASVRAEVVLGEENAGFLLPKAAADGAAVGSAWQRFGNAVEIPGSSGFRTHLDGSLALTVTGARPAVNASVDDVAWLMWQVEDPAVGEVIVG